MEKPRKLLPSDLIKAMRESVESPEAFGFVYLEHRDYVLQQVRHSVYKPEDAEDVTQDVFEAAFKNREQPVFDANDDAPVLSWLKGITRRKITDHRRDLLGRRIKKPALASLEDFPNLPSDETDPAKLFEEKDTVSSLASCFPKDRRTIPYSLALDEMSKETSGEIGISNGRVSQIIKAARETAIARKII